ncbi:hypothetical protein FG170_10735 [Serratia marcescens]|nr:hypothetical protein FG170_10735 [Serratia marcescens]
MATAPFLRGMPAVSNKNSKTINNENFIFDRDRAIFDELFDSFNQIEATPDCAMTSANTTQRPSEVFFGDHIEAINDVA